MNHRAASFPSLLAAALTACSGQQGNAPPRVPVSVARAERRTVPIEVPATGSVEPIQTAAVVPQVEGLVRRVRFQEGQEVAAGQVLFEIDPRQYQAALQQAEANLARDLVQAENAVRDADRYAVLAESASVSQADYQAKRASADALVAAVRADSAALAVARLNVEYATIRAPIAGRTGGLMVREGNVVRPGAGPALVTINELRPILVRFSVPAGQLPDLLRVPKSGPQRRVLARPGRDATAQPSPALEGVLAFIDNHVDSSTGTVLLKARFPNSDGQLWPGEFVEVRLVLDEDPDVTVVPAQAVLTSQQGSYVFVVTTDGHAKQQPVTVARTMDSLAVIAQGLTPGTMVVTDGQSRLTPDARVDVRSGPTVEMGAGSDSRR